MGTSAPTRCGAARANVHRIALFILTELEVSRRVVEAPQVSLKPEERNRLLSEQAIEAAG